MVEVVPLGKVRPVFAEVAAAHLQAIFDLPAKVSAAQPEPEYAFLPNRGQYDATPILLALAKEPDSPPLRLGLMAGDLCLPFLSHVFGEAQLEGRSAVVSLHRLRGASRAEPDGGSLLLERIAKVALHEIAHVIGLVHCQSKDCLMNFTSGLEHLDRLKMSLCVKCQMHFTLQRQRLTAKAGPASPESSGRRFAGL